MFLFEIMDLTNRFFFISSSLSVAMQLQIFPSSYFIISFYTRNKINLFMILLEIICSNSVLYHSFKFIIFFHCLLKENWGKTCLAFFCNAEIKKISYLWILKTIISFIILFVKQKTTLLLKAPCQANTQFSFLASHKKLWYQYSL